MSDYTPNL